MPGTKKNWVKSKAQIREEALDREIDKISNAALAALKGDCGIQGLTQKAYAQKGIIKSERTLTNWSKLNLDGVDFREVFRSLILAGYTVEVSFKKGGVTFGNV